jgi:hypothetical protein
VKLRTGAHVTDVQPGYVMVGDERIDAVVTLWAAGVQASPLGKMLGVETDKRGCVMVDEHLNPKGHPEIFVCGDLAHVEQDGKQVPGVAQPAMQMGTMRRGGSGAGGPGGGFGGPWRQGLPLLRQGRHGDHRAQGGSGEDRVAVQGALERLPGVAGVADGAYLFSDRLQQPAGRLQRSGRGPT